MLQNGKISIRSTASNGIKLRLSPTPARVEEPATRRPFSKVKVRFEPKPRKFDDAKLPAELFECASVAPFELKMLCAKTEAISFKPVA